MRQFTINLIISTVSLCTGILIYIAFRPETYAVQMISDFFPADRLRDLLWFADNGFIKYYLTDYLWALSFCCFLKLFNEKIITCLAIVIVCGITYELFQYLELISGTGDVHDVIMYIIAVITAYIINLIKGEMK